MDVEIAKVLDDKRGRLDVVGPNETVCDAVARMNERNIGSLLVMAGDLALGIFTERDVLTRVVAMRRDPSTTQVREVMTSKLLTVTPSTTVREAMQLMTDRRCRHLPVMHEGRVIGMISIGDLTRWVLRDQQRTIEDLTDYIHHAG